MKGINLMDAFSDFKELKNIDKETMAGILDDIFRSMIIKRWGADDGFDIVINSERGDLEIIRTRKVVPDGELDDEIAEIELSQARKVVDDLDLDEELIEEIKIEDFGRRNILAMPIPQFSTLRGDIDPKLEAIIQRSLERDREQRYQSGYEMLTALELYLYSDGYGPTNEKLGVYLMDLFGIKAPIIPLLSRPAS